MDVIVNLPLDVQQCRQFVFFSQNNLIYYSISRLYINRPTPIPKTPQPTPISTTLQSDFSSTVSNVSLFFEKKLMFLFFLGITNKTNHNINNKKQFYFSKTNLYLFEGSDTCANACDFAKKNQILFSKLFSF